MRSFFSLLALAAPLATAHFTLDFPLSRGFDEDIEPSTFILVLWSRRNDELTGV